MKSPTEWCALFYQNKITYLEDLVRQVQDEAITESIDAILQSVTELKQKHGAKNSVLHESTKVYEKKTKSVLVCPYFWQKTFKSSLSIYGS